MAHIAMFVLNLAGGGAERSILLTSTALANIGHQVDIVIFDSEIAYIQEFPETVCLIVLDDKLELAGGSVPDTTVLYSNHLSIGQNCRHLFKSISKHPISVYYLHRKRITKRALRFAHYVTRERPDLIFCNLRDAEDAAFFASHFVNSPPIIPIVRNVTTHRKRSLYIKQCNIYDSASHIVAISNGVADHISYNYGISKQKITTIYNPVFRKELIQHAKAEPDHAWFRDSGPPIILGCGRLHLQKDFPTLIEAFCLLLKYHEFRLIILGVGDQRSELNKLIQKLCIENYVSMPGWSDNPYAYMFRAALFVLSSRHEGLANVLIEALACGCPAVSTDCPSGPSEILNDPNLLAPVGNPEALSHVMLRVLSCPVDREALQANASRFSIERATTAYDNLISKYIS